MRTQTAERLLCLASHCHRHRFDWAREALTLAQRVDAQIQASAERPPQAFNLIEMLGAKEPKTSACIATLFRHRETAGATVWTSFVQTFLAPLGLDAASVCRPVVSEEKAHVDILVRDRDYCVIFENKLKGAAFQRNQLARYIRRMQDEGYPLRRIFIVLLPRTTSRRFLLDDVPASAWRLPDDFEQPNAARRCRWADETRCLCDNPQAAPGKRQAAHCAKCTDFRRRFLPRTAVLHEDFARWVASVPDVVAPGEILLRSAAVQFADFLHGLYHTRKHDLFNMQMQQYLRQQLLDGKASAPAEQFDILSEHIRQVDELRQHLDGLQIALSLEMVRQWQAEFEAYLAKVGAETQVFHDDHSFGFRIQGVWCGIWDGTKNAEHQHQPYWAFQTDGEVSAALLKRIQKVIDGAELGVQAEFPSRSGWMVWDSTRHGFDRVKALFDSARALGFVK